jgi:SGNH hydrolase-like domain, acetyltransferase AlgX
MTQPALWHADLSREEDAFLWLGGVGRKQHYKGYLAPADLEVAMDGFNRQLLESARAEGVEVFDLSAQVPKTLSVFYDDAHFTNEGARVVAEKVYEYLNSAPVPKQSPRTPSIVTFAR